MRYVIVANGYGTYHIWFNGRTYIDRELAESDCDKVRVQLGNSPLTVRVVELVVE